MQQYTELQISLSSPGPAKERFLTEGQRTPLERSTKGGRPKKCNFVPLEYIFAFFIFGSLWEAAGCSGDPRSVFPRVLTADFRRLRSAFSKVSANVFPACSGTNFRRSPQQVYDVSATHFRVTIVRATAVPATKFFVTSDFSLRPVFRTAWGRLPRHSRSGPLGEADGWS